MPEQILESRHTDLEALKLMFSRLFSPEDVTIKPVRFYSEVDYHLELPRALTKEEIKWVSHPDRPGDYGEGYDAALTEAEIRELEKDKEVVPEREKLRKKSTVFGSLWRVLSKITH